MFKIAKSKTGVCLNNLLKISVEQQRNVRLRKPPWEPLAKSKQFRVPPEKKRDIEEYNYIIPIVREYKAQMRSMYQLFKTEFKYSNQESMRVREDIRIQVKAEQALLELNEKFNKQMLEKQLEEAEVKLEEKKKQVEKEYLDKLNLEKSYREVAKKKFQIISEKSKSFIDQSNVEYEIEKMLNERHDYNFSIDYKGRTYKGQSVVTREQLFNTTFVPSANESNQNEPSLLSANPETPNQNTTS